MNLSKFIDNNVCPMCGKALTLCVRARNNSLWKAARRTHPTGYLFQQHLIKNKNLSEKDSFILDVEGDNYNIHCNSNSLKNETRTWQFFLFYICNDGAIVKEFDKYYINTHDSCYIRNSTMLQFTPEGEGEDIKWNLGPVISDSTNPDKSEIFSLKTKTESKVEKIYSLTLNYEAKTTKLYHYTVTEEQAKDAQYEPNVFQKEMPLMTVRPNFSDKPKLIERLDSWILMS